MQIKDLLIRQKDNDKKAIIYGSHSITYNDLYKKVTSVTAYIENESKEFRNIGIFIHNSINYVISYFSITFLDKVIVPINPREKKNELTSTIEYCELGLIITDSNNADLIRKYLKDCTFPVKVFNIDTMNFEKIERELELPISYQNDDLKNVALLLHTSGSLSIPKRVMLTHENLISCVKSIIKSLELKTDDRTLIALPMFLASANTSQMLTHIYLGASIIIMDALFTPGYLLYMVEKHKVTNFTGVPYMVLLLIEYKKVKIYDISSLNFVCFGGAPTPEKKIEELINTFPEIKFIHMYGQTEASTRISHLLPSDSIRKVGSVGKPIPGVGLRIVDEHGIDVHAGEVGEVIVKGSNVMKGYYKRSEQTLQTIKDGWLYTGDMGKLDGEGFLYIVGRKKNIIIKGGMNIYPEEIEEVLLLHPYIKEACVFGESDEILGEIPIARVVLEEDAFDLSEDDIKKYCFKSLTSFKLPSRIVFVNKIIKTYSGKIKRV